MSDPIVTIGCVSNLYSRMMHFVNAGDVEQGHCHAHDHLTLLAKGKLKVTVNGQDTTFTAPHMIFIKAGVEHRLEAATDQTVAYCIHALRYGERVEDILDPASIPEGITPDKVEAIAAPILQPRYV